LKPSIVSRAESLSQKHCKNLKNTQINTHLSQYPSKQILLSSSMLTRRICFRTPWETKEFENLPNRGNSFDPKAGFGDRFMGLCDLLSFLRG
jgi:hypothetical protein